MLRLRVRVCARLGCVLLSFSISACLSPCVRVFVCLPSCERMCTASQRMCARMCCVLFLQISPPRPRADCGLARVRARIRAVGQTKKERKVTRVQERRGKATDLQKDWLSRGTSPAWQRDLRSQRGPAWHHQKKDWSQERSPIDHHRRRQKRDWPPQWSPTDLHHRTGWIRSVWKHRCPC